MIFVKKQRNLISAAIVIFLKLYLILSNPFMSVIEK